MKLFALILMPWMVDAFAQSTYFTVENKIAALEAYQKKIYEGCSYPKEQQDPVSSKQMKGLVNQAYSILNENFSKAFQENPKIKEALEKDLNNLSLDPECQKLGNHCRAKLIGLSLFYYQQFRPDITDCEEYVKKAPVAKGYKADCELELKYRKSNLQGVTSGYGLPGVGSYRKDLIALKNSTTIQLFYKIIHEDNKNLHICNPVQSGVIHKYSLNMDDPGQYLEGMSMESQSNVKSSKDCVDLKIDLFAEFVPASFDDRDRVGLDVVEPVKTKLLELIKKDPNTKITDIAVTSFSAKAPYYIKDTTGKSIIDEKSNDKNLTRAQERGSFVEKIFEDLKKSSSEIREISFTIDSSLGGPDFSPIDLNERFVTKMTSDYMDRIEALYKKNIKKYEEEALEKSSENLYNEKIYVNLYQAKFKPFHGYRIIVKGFKKDQMKCLDLPVLPKNKSEDTSKQ